jgi:geranylgeranyl transferase type-1 subunit beta
MLKGVLTQLQRPVSGMSVYDQGHIAMTYVALNMLLILGDDFKRLNRSAILTALKYLQQPDGRFSLNLHLSLMCCPLRLFVCLFVCFVVLRLKGFLLCVVYE